MKQCSKCKETKELTEFASYESSSDGRQYYCKTCMQNYNSSTNPIENKKNMYVNGKYVSRKHPLHKAGKYKTLGDAWSNIEIDERTSEGSVYIIHNKVWPNWYKVGKAVSAEDRLNSYQTSAPYRDYELLHAVEFDDRHRAESNVHQLLRNVIEDDHCRGEWFKADLDVIKDMIEVVKATDKQLDMFSKAG